MGEAVADAGVKGGRAVRGTVRQQQVTVIFFGKETDDETQFNETSQNIKQVRNSFVADQIQDEN